MSMMRVTLRTHLNGQRNCNGDCKEEGVALTEKHFLVLNYLRDRFARGEALSIRGINKSGIVEVKDFYQMFPGAPLKNPQK